MKGEAGHFVGHDEPTVLGKAEHMEKPYSMLTEPKACAPGIPG